MSPPLTAKDGDRPKTLLMVRHRTRLEYEEPGYQSHTELRMTPVDTGLQRVLTQGIEIDPPGILRPHRDYFGNVVHRFNQLGEHEDLEIVAESLVETTDAVACGPEASPDPRPWRERWAEYLAPSPRVPALEGYREVDHEVATNAEPEAFAEALLSLAGWFVDSFEYRPGATDVNSTPDELFRGGAGVCQDFAHAMIGVLRSSGVPARYASGYVYDPPHGPETAGVRGAGASHAWVQAWQPEVGWIGADPTNRKLVDWQYVRVAIGRDYGDVRPMRGILFGGGEQELEVAVEVTRAGVATAP